MKIAVFYEKEEKHTADVIERIIISHNCTVITHQAEEIWNAEIYSNPAILLHGITHVLFIFGTSLIKNPVFLFFCGMGIGRNLPILILEQKHRIHLAVNCRQHTIILTPETFENYFVREQENFMKNAAKRLAREELLNRGYPCFDANFISVVKHGENDIVKLFLQAGFDPSLRDTRGTPLLSVAVRERHYETTMLLLSSGADVNLCAEDRSYSALMEAAQLGDFQTAQLLLSSNADPNMQSKDGQTALILAIGRKDIPMVKILLEHHADITITDTLGMSALGYAKLFNNKEILSLMTHAE